jgi:hypothetical protein
VLKWRRQLLGIILAPDGTKWEVSDRPEDDQSSSLRKRWDVEIAVEIGPGSREISKLSRSFLSMCAGAFHDDVLTDSNPKPPPVLQKEVSAARVNIGRQYSLFSRQNFLLRRKYSLFR